MTSRIVSFTNGVQVLSTKMDMVHPELPTSIQENYQPSTCVRRKTMNSTNMYLLYDPEEAILQECFTQILKNIDGTDYLVVSRAGRVGSKDVPLVIKRFKNYISARQNYKSQCKEWLKSNHISKLPKYIAKADKEIINSIHSYDENWFSFRPSTVESVVKNAQENIDVAECRRRYESFTDELKILVPLFIPDYNQSETMKLMSNDLSKTPLGYPASFVITIAYRILDSLEVEIKRATDNITVFSNYFHVPIPSCCGENDKKGLPTIDSIEMVNEKRLLLKALEQKSFRDELTLPYPARACLMLERLEYPLIEMGKNIELYQHISDLIERLKLVSRSDPHPFHLVNIFSFDTSTTSTNTTNTLLWHGTDLTNIYNILKNGYDTKKSLKGNFGRGIYFADTIVNSIKYCREITSTPSSINRDIMLLLNEVQLGRVKSLTTANTGLVRAPEGYDSVMGVGKICHDEKNCIFDQYGANFHTGKLITSDELLGSAIQRRYNEYVIFNKNQVKLRYIVVLKIIPEKKL